VSFFTYTRIVIKVRL